MASIHAGIVAETRINGVDYDSARALFEKILASRAAFVTLTSMPILLLLWGHLDPDHEGDCTSDAQDNMYDLVGQLMPTTMIFISFAVLYPHADIPAAMLPAAKGLLAVLLYTSGLLAYRVCNSGRGRATESALRTLMPASAVCMFAWNLYWTNKLNGAGVWERFRKSYGVFICCRMGLSSLLRCLEPQPQTYPPGSLSFPGVCVLNIYNLALVIAISPSTRQSLVSMVGLSTITLTLDNLRSHSLQKPLRDPGSVSDRISACANSDADAHSDLRRSATLTKQEEVSAAILESHHIHVNRLNSSACCMHQRKGMM